MKFVAIPYHLELLTLYVRPVLALENLQRLQKAPLHIIYVVVLIPIEGIAPGAKNHVIMIPP